MKFIKANLAYSSGLSIGQHDGSTNKVSLSFMEFGEDCARSRFGYGHDAALFGCKEAEVANESVQLVASARQSDVHGVPVWWCHIRGNS